MDGVGWLLIELHNTYNTMGQFIQINKLNYVKNTFNNFGAVAAQRMVTPPQKLATT